MATSNTPSAEGNSVRANGTNAIRRPCATTKGRPIFLHTTRKRKTTQNAVHPLLFTLKGCVTLIEVEKHFEKVHSILELSQVVSKLELACRGCDMTFSH